MEYSIAKVFLASDQILPAGLVIILLIRAGIEQNPGPIPGRGWICKVCCETINDKFQQSVFCYSCNNWCHFRTKKNNNCSQLRTRKAHSLSYKCPICVNSQQPQPAPQPAQADPPPPAQSDPQPNQGPKVSKSKRNEICDIKFLQFNCNGIKGKVDQITDWLLENDIKVAALQETKLSDKSKTPVFANGKYTVIRKDRGTNGGGGLIFLIDESIQFETVPETIKDKHIEHLTIKINNISIVNIYIPPASSCSAGYIPDLTPFLPQSDAMVVGDVNAHDPLWNSSIQDARGILFSEVIGDSNFGVLNLDTPTRLPTNGQPTSPDLSLASLSLLPYTTWETDISLGSDHLPIIITCKTDIKVQFSEKKTFTNFKKADWPRFTEDTELEFAKLTPPQNVHKAEKCFRKIINNASKKCIPQGRIKKIIPEIPTEAANKMKERDELRKSTPDSPQIAELNKEIENSIHKHKQTKWRDYVGDINRKTDPAKLFKLIKNLNGQPSSPANQAIKFKGKYLSSANKIANGFKKQFSSVITHKSSKFTRKITRESKKKSLSDAEQYTPNQTKEAIKQAKASRALGPDGISNVHLKHLGPHGISYLTELFNISTSQCLIPQIWKTSTIVPLLKPGKESDESTSYRPVPSYVQQ